MTLDGALKSFDAEASWRFVDWLLGVWRLAIAILRTRVATASPGRFDRPRGRSRRPSTFALCAAVDLGKAPPPPGGDLVLAALGVRRARDVPSSKEDAPGSSGRSRKRSCAIWRGGAPSAGASSIAALVE